MGRRRRTPVLFESAGRNITNLEARVVYQSIQPKFTMDDVVNWLFQPEAVERCKAAYGYADRVRDTFSHEVALPVMAAGYQDCDLYLAFDDEFPMLAPHEKWLNVDLGGGGFYGPIRDTMAEVVSIHHKFEKMRGVVDWAQLNLSPAAAHDYVPWIGGVLNNDDPFHAAEGKTYKEPVKAPGPQMLEWMRECGTIMGTALLCPDIENDTRNSFGFSVAKPTYMNNSQRFWLL